MSSIEHTVEKGEDLFHVGKKYGVNWRIISNFNNLDAGAVQAGQTLSVPTSTQALSDLVDALNKWYETHDPSDVTALCVQLETFARDANVTQEQIDEWLATVNLQSAGGVVGEFYTNKKLTTLSYFIGEFSGEWRKYLNADTK